MPGGRVAPVWLLVAMGLAACFAVIVLAALRVVFDPDTISQLSTAAEADSFWMFLGITGHNPLSEFDLAMQWLLTGAVSITTMKAAALLWSMLGLGVLACVGWNLGERAVGLAVLLFVYASLGTTYVLAAWPISFYAATLAMSGVVVLGLLMWSRSCDRGGLMTALWVGMIVLICAASPLLALFVCAAWGALILGGESWGHIAARKWLWLSLWLIMPVGAAATAIALYPNPNLGSPRPALWSLLLPLSGVPMDIEGIAGWLMDRSAGLANSALLPLRESDSTLNGLWLIACGIGGVGGVVRAIAGCSKSRVLLLYVAIALGVLVVLGLLGKYPFGLIRYALPLIPAGLGVLVLGWLGIARWTSEVWLTRAIVLLVLAWCAYCVVLESRDMVRSRGDWTHFQQVVQEHAGGSVLAGRNSWTFLTETLDGGHNLRRLTTGDEGTGDDLVLTYRLDYWSEPPPPERGLPAFPKGSLVRVASTGLLSTWGWGLQGRHLWRHEHGSREEPLVLERGAQAVHGPAGLQLRLPPGGSAFFWIHGPIPAGTVLKTSCHVSGEGDIGLECGRHGGGPAEASPWKRTRGLPGRISATHTLSHEQAGVRSLLRNMGPQSVEVTVSDWMLDVASTGGSELKAQPVLRSP